MKTQLIQMQKEDLKKIQACQDSNHDPCDPGAVL